MSATAILMASLPPRSNVFVIARQYEAWIEPGVGRGAAGHLRVRW